MVVSYGEAYYSTDQEGNIYIEFESLDEIESLYKRLKNEATNVLGGTE